MGRLSPKREPIARELRKRSYPQTAADLQERLGLGASTGFVCRLMALEGLILERRYHGAFWYAARTTQWRDYQIEARNGTGRGRGWRTMRFCDTEVGARMLIAHWMKDAPIPYRLIHGGRVIGEWNTQATEEIDTWRESKRVLRKVLKHLHASNLPTAGSTPPPTSSA